MLPALVLTAGLGTRLDPLTRLVAKPAVPLAGSTLIERVLEGLRAQGVVDVVLNLHHRPESITAIVGDGTHLGLRVRYSWEQPILGSAGGPRRALPLLDAETFLIINGDTLSDVALAAMIQSHLQHRAEVTMALVPNERPDHYNGIVLDARGDVIGFVPKGASRSQERPGSAGDTENWHFIGVQVAGADVFASLDDGVPAETVAGIYRERVAQRPGLVRGWRVTTTFIDVGTPRDYLMAALELAGDLGDNGIIEAGGMVDRSAHLTRSMVWPNARVGPGARLDEVIVAGNVSVPGGFVAREAVIVPSSVVRPTDDVETHDGFAVFPL